MNALSARERQLVAVALLLVVAVAVWLGVVAPVLDGFRARRDARTAAADQLQHDARLIGAFAGVRVRLGEAQRAAGVWALRGASAPLATEAARARVVHAVADSGGALDALRDQPGQPGQIRLQADARIDDPGLAALLHRLEDQAPFASVERLLVTAGETAPTAHPTPLQVRLDVMFRYVPSH